MQKLKFTDLSESFTHVQSTITWSIFWIWFLQVHSDVADPPIVVVRRSSDSADRCSVSLLFDTTHCWRSADTSLDASAYKSVAAPRRTCAASVPPCSCLRSHAPASPGRPDDVNKAFPGQQKVRYVHRNQTQTNPNKPKQKVRYVHRRVGQSISSTEYLKYVYKYTERIFEGSSL